MADVTTNLGLILFMSGAENESHKPRKILTIDGGGIRYMIVVEILTALEANIREETRDKNRWAY